MAARWPVATLFWQSCPALGLGKAELLPELEVELEVERSAAERLLFA